MKLLTRLLLGVPGVLLAACGDDITTPLPLDVDDPPAVPADVVTWLQDAAIPISTVEPDGSFSDLEPLKELIGDARVVALGEATHGTREFFRLKDRLFRFLVQEMDFNVFAMEASLPESRRIDAYVKGAPADASELLSGLYLWTLNTQSVLDQIEWMRAHNQAPGGAPAVSFVGFDMSYAGMAVSNVEKFLETHAPDSAAAWITNFDCLREFVNGADGQPQRTGWVVLPPEERSDCRWNVDQVIEFLSRHQAELEASASPEEFNNVVRDAVLVLQWEGYESVRAGALRDFFMADNVSWLLEQAGPDAKMVVSGHNIHMNYREDWQGEFMREEFGDDLVSIGLTFGEGSFNAITRLLSGEFRGLEVQRSGPAPSSSYEYRFAATSLSAFALDLKNADLVVGQSDWLATPFWLRNVGSVYEPEDPAFYFFRDIPITELFDGILYVDTTTESLLLPFNYPSEF